MMFNLPFKLPKDWSVKTVEQLISDNVIEKPLDGNHGGIHPKTTDYVDSGVPFIMASDLENGRVNFNSCKFITEQQASTLKKGFSKAGDVLLSHKATIGRTAIVQDSENEFIVLTPQVTYYRIKDKRKLNNQYLKVYFDSRFFQSILGLWAGAGTTRAYLGITGQLKLPVIVPPIDSQNSIAEYAECFNDKIELNRKINLTLEAMAQAIFKSWFVDFEPVKAKIVALEEGKDEQGVTRAAMRAISGKTDEELDQLQAEQPEHYTQLKNTAELFPAATQDSELGEIPEGWESKAFSKVIDVNPVRRLPKEKLATKVSMADLNTWQSWIDSWQKEEYKSGPKFKNGDTLFARITPSLENGKTAFVNFLSAGETAFGSTEFIVFGPKIVASGSYIFCLSRGKHIRETAINAMTGTSGRQRVPNNFFDHLLICVPSDNIVGKFNEITVSLFKMIEHNSKESIHLKKARDSLLPKLLSGELPVAAADLAEGN